MPAKCSSWVQRIASLLWADGQDDAVGHGKREVKTTLGGKQRQGGGKVNDFSLLHERRLQCGILAELRQTTSLNVRKSYLTPKYEYEKVPVPFGSPLAIGDPKSP
jgi:hypothetical protein